MSRDAAADPLPAGATAGALDEAGVAPLSVVRPPVRIADTIARELAGWLEPPDAASAGARLRAWDGRTWAAFRRVVAMHGLASHLVRGIPPNTLAALLPFDALAWLTGQDDRNECRIRRLHDDLARILGAAATAGIEVMPLKGALLTTIGDGDPFRRPMGDLDLLVHPTDREPFGAVLVGLGYRHAPERNPRPTHDVYLDPGGGRLVSTDGEHPDNPRRVEVHVEVKRHLWAWADDADDLTPLLWDGATPVSIVGQPACVPRPAALFAHLAIHASSDLLAGRGRLVQWLDLATVASRVAIDPAVLPHPRQAYPAFRLAARAQPRSTLGRNLAALETGLPRRLVDWAATVPLDHRAGLTTGRSPDRPSSVADRWERWRPDPWRLAVAYGDRPLPLALARHALTVARRLGPG